MKYKIPLGVIFIAIAIIVILHQVLFYGEVFQWEDIHHESIVVAFAFAGAVLILRRRKII